MVLPYDRIGSAVWRTTAQQHKPRLVKEWDACRKHVKQPLIDKMKSFDATREGKKRKNFFRRAKSMLKVCLVPARSTV